MNSPQSLIQRASTQVPTQVPFVPFVFTFLPRQAAEPLSPGSLLYALNCFNMSEYMSDEHVLGTPGAPPCRATCPASEPCRARAKVGILPRIFFFRNCRLIRQFRRTCPASEPPACRACAAPRSGFFRRGRDSDFALDRGRFSDFALASDFARKIRDAMGSASLPELGFIPKNPSPGQRRRSGSDAVLAASLPECFFFTIHTPSRQSWRGRRIAHSILAWQQDCPKKPITGPAPEVRQRGCPCSIADRVFFHHSHALPSILLWQQD